MNKLEISAKGGSASGGKNWIFVFLLLGLVFVPSLFAEKITVLYTGETHATLYPCSSCPLKAAGGGLPKRATKVNEARKNSRNILLVDSGGSFAGGLLDQYTQNVDLDKERTNVALSAMELMGYDAIAVGDEELSFGEEFLKNISKSKGVNFISSNISNDYLAPFLVKKIGNIKIGILALAPREAKSSLSGSVYLEPEEALEKNIGLLKAQGADVIILLSHLEEDEALGLARNTGGIDLLITGHRLSQAENLPDEIDNKETPQTGKRTIIVRPAFQGKELGVIDLEVEGGKIINHKIDNVVINEDVPDDAKVSSVVPACFSDNNCHKKALWGTCENPATRLAKCVYKKSIPVPVLIIKPKVCLTCDDEKTADYFKNTFGEVKISYLDNETKQAKDLIKKMDIKMLPTYIFGKEVEKNSNFTRLSKFLIPNNDRYMLDPSVLGVSFFTDREKKKYNFDLFISLFDKNTEELLRLSDELMASYEKMKLNVHFLGLINNGGVRTPYGLLEFEEDLRSVCVMNKYPDKWRNYVSCRLKNIESSWWDECLDTCGMNINSIRQCAGSDEGRNLLLENIKLSSEMVVMSPGTFLIDNQDVLSTMKVPKKEELDKKLKMKGW